MHMKDYWENIHACIKKNDTLSINEALNAIKKISLLKQKNEFKNWSIYNLIFCIVKK